MVPIHTIPLQHRVDAFSTRDSFPGFVWLPPPPPPLSLSLSPPSGFLLSTRWHMYIGLRNALLPMTFCPTGPHTESRDGCDEKALVVLTLVWTLCFLLFLLMPFLLFSSLLTMKVNDTLVRLSRNLVPSLSPHLSLSLSLSILTLYYFLRILCLPYFSLTFFLLEPFVHASPTNDAWC